MEARKILMQPMYNKTHKVSFQLLMCIKFLNKALDYSPQRTA